MGRLFISLNHHFLMLKSLKASSDGKRVKIYLISSSIKWILCYYRTIWGIFRCLESHSLPEKLLYIFSIINNLKRSGMSIILSYMTFFFPPSLWILYFLASCISHIDDNHIIHPEKPLAGGIGIDLNWTRLDQHNGKIFTITDFIGF